MKKLIAFFFALASGGYLLTLGILPDPIFLIDEATALFIFVQAMGYLGFDLKRFIGLGKGKKSKDDVIDV